MYIPKSFNIDDWSIVEAVINEYSFVDLLGILDGEIIISKNPIIYKGNGVFHFHLAKGNPLIKVINESKCIDLLVSGPHEYVSPAWYAASPAVPTWNYVAIQINLKCEVSSGDQWLIDHHDDLKNKFERFGWNNELPSDFRFKLNGMIDGVVANVIGFKAKFKLGQNRSNEDFSGIYKGLKAIDNDNGLARMMLKLFPEKLNGNNNA